MKPPNLSDFQKKSTRSSIMREIEVRHDFDWHAMFGWNRISFPGYMDLARQVLQDCRNLPQPKRPILALTTNPELPPGGYDTENDFIVVVNINKYLETKGSTAQSYFKNLASLTDIGRFTEFSRIVSSEPSILSAILTEHMSVAAILNWVHKNPDNLQVLNNSLDTLSTNRPISHEGLATALCNVQELDGELLEALSVLLSRGISKDVKRVLLDAMLKDRTGREAVSAFMGLRIADRLLDVRQAISEFESLISSGTACETDMQAFLKAHPWLIGLEYACVKPQRPMIQGHCDFQLIRFDAYYDILELKSPEDDLVIIKPSDNQDKRPPPSAFSYSHDLAQALAQAHVYRDQMARNPEHARDMNWTPTREPKIVIVIGQWSKLTALEQRTISLLNNTLHNAEIIPYDMITQRARRLLDNVEEILSVIDQADVQAEQHFEPQLGASSHAKLSG